MPPGQETSPEYPLSESICETQPLNPILDVTAAQLVASPHRSLLPWPPVPQRATPTGSTPRSNAQSLIFKSFLVHPPILELRPCGGTELKTLKTDWSSRCHLKSLALSSSEVSWKGGTERPETGDHPQGIFLRNIVVR